VFNILLNKDSLNISNGKPNNLANIELSHFLIIEFSAVTYCTLYNVHAMAYLFKKALTGGFFIMFDTKIFLPSQALLIISWMWDENIHLPKKARERGVKKSGGNMTFSPPETEFLDVIQKSFPSSLLLFRHLYSFALRCLFLQTHAT
jgi:hypothetical protein